jgi:hypothetical protein
LRECCATLAILISFIAIEFAYLQDEFRFFCCILQKSDFWLLPFFLLSFQVSAWFDLSSRKTKTEKYLAMKPQKEDPGSMISVNEFLQSLLDSLDERINSR